MRRTIARFTLIAGLAVGAAGCGMIGGDDSSAGDEQQQGQQEPTTSDDGGEESVDSGADSSDGEELAAMSGPGQDVVAAEAVAESSLTIDGTTMTFELKGVTANSTSATVHAVLTNAGTAPTDPDFFDADLVPEGAGYGSNSQFNVLTLTDDSTGNLHTPAYTAEGHCLCTDFSGELDAGETVVVSAQYAPLSEGAETATVRFGVMGSFENIPVTWS